jgi:shikimate kinase
MAETAENRTVLLCGLPGSGKTETGKLLAGMLDIPFADLDECIERETGRSISDIFAGQGEPRFREIEADVLSGLLRGGSPLVIALGGGALESEKARAAIERPDALTIWLQVDPKLAAARLENSASVDIHPLLQGLRGEKLYNRLSGLHEARRLNYQMCRSAVQTDDLSPPEAAGHIRRLIGRR